MLLGADTGRYWHNVIACLFNQPLPELPAGRGAPPHMQCLTRALPARAIAASLHQNHSFPAAPHMTGA